MEWWKILIIILIIGWILSGIEKKLKRVDDLEERVDALEDKLDGSDNDDV